MNRGTTVALNRPRKPQEGPPKGCLILANTPVCWGPQKGPGKPVNSRGPF